MSARRSLARAFPRGLWFGVAVAALVAVTATRSLGAPAPCADGTLPAAIMGTMAGFGIDGNLQAGDGFGSDWYGIAGGDVGGVIGRSTCSPIPAGSLDTFFGGPRTGFDGNWAGAGIDRVFGGTSNKDENCIGPGLVSGNWTYKCGSGPMKDDITEVYLTRRKSANNHTILILGVGDRSTSGDKNLGVVFFRNGIHATGNACDGLLIGDGPNCGHTNDDRFFAIEFSNGGTRACFIERRWVTDHYEAVTPVQGADPLVIAAVSQTSTPAPCGAVATGSSGAVVNSYDARQFSEIAFDLTALGVPNEELCGPNFDIMIQTRSSTSLTAELKDFVIVPFSPLPSPRAAVADVQICAGSSAQLCANETSGQAPYRYLWNTGETSECITTSGAGAYWVTVTDANGCSGSDSGSVVVNPRPTAAVPSLEVCAGSSTQLCANAASGTPPYSYLWSTGETGSCITVAQAGPYSVTVTDSKGCQVTSQGALVVDPKPTAAVPDGQVCGTIAPLQLCANAASGTPPYTYRWSNGATSACISVTAAGNYSVTVTDAKGCTVADAGNVVEACPEGCTPGFWCGGVGSTMWNTASDPEWTALGGQGTNPYTLSTRFESVFAPSAAIADAKTMSDLLCNGAGPAPAEKAARAVIAAYLNASYGLAFPNTAAQVAAKWAAAVGSNSALNALAVELNAANQVNCPIGRSSALVGNDGQQQMQTPDVTGQLDFYRPSPNPFTGTTRFAFLVPAGADENVSIAVYDLLGRRIRGLANGVMSPGRHEASWDGRDEGGNLVKRGLYFVSTAVGSQRRTLHVLFLK